MKGEALEKVRPKFNALKEFVGDKQFALGYLTLADFILAENLAYFEALFPTEHKNYGFWWKLRFNFNELPEIKAYYKRPDAFHGPFWPTMASLQPKVNNVKIAYWNIRGLAHVSRLLLAYHKVDFENVAYTDG